METLPGILNACPNVHQGPSANLFLTLINALIAAQCKLGPDGRYPPDYGPSLKDGDEFDFIVVGAGTAGSVVANRLSQESKWNVLVLEAGGYPTVTTEIPGLYPILQGTSEDWQYPVEPSTTCCVGKNRCRYARGKVLGGSSTINGMHYGRSIKHDHDKWAKAGKGWDHESIVKHYKAIENVHIEGNHVYGNTGEVHLTKYASSLPLRHTFREVFEEMGYYEFEEDTPIGYRDTLQNIYKGTRQSMAKTFLAPVKERKNLHVAINVNVNKLLVDHNLKAVQGVELTIGDRRLKIKAKKEVILSAGTIGSPQILMNSGIGPKEHLSKLGIEVVKDLRVGDNLHDHLLLPVIAATLDKTTIPLGTPEEAVDAMYQMFTQRLNDQDITNFAAFINTKNKTGFADIEIISLLVRQNEGYILGGLELPFGVPKEVIQTLQKHNEEAPILLFLLFNLVPKSRGSVRIQNTDPSLKPWVQPNCLSDTHNQDLEVMLDGVKFVQEMLKTKAFERYKPKLVELDIINCREFSRKTEDFWRCVVENLSVPSNQHVGTCKMGPLSDLTAVVDSRLKVHGVKGVRVIDASVIPILSTNPFGPSIMIGEKGANVVKEDWSHHHGDL